MEFEWDPDKAADNLQKHGVRFAEARTVFEDDSLATMHDEHPDEDRFVAMGMSSLGRVLTVIYTVREDRLRIISARKATPMERTQYEGWNR